MNQFDRSLSSVGIGALLSVALAALSSLLSMITSVSFFSVLAILLAALGAVLVILILLKIKGKSGSAVSSLSGSASPEGNVRSAIHQLERMAEGNFSDETPSGNSDPLLNAVAHLRNTLGQIMSGVSEEANAISDSGILLSSASERFSQGFFRQGEMLSGIYDSVTTVSKAAVKNAEIAREANGYAAAAADDVQKGSDQMQELLGAMDEINRSTDEIAKFIKTIEDIAFQTNILALNSSVEAAHAGEAGKGFAVVATEVKTLANRSQETAKNTSRLIQSCVASARIGVEKTSAAVKALAAASEETRSVRGLIDVISRECDAQSNSIGNINQDFAQIEGIMNSASAAATECAERIQTLSGHSDRLKSDLKDFKGMARSRTNRAVRPVESESVEPAPKPAARTTSAAKPSAPAPKSVEKTTSAAKPSAPAPKPVEKTISAAKPSAPAPKPVEKTTSAAKPSAPAPKPVEKTTSTAKPSAPAPKPAAKATSAASTAKPSAPAPKPVEKTTSAAKSSVSAPKPAAKITSTASAAKPSAPAPKPAARTASASVPKPTAAGVTAGSTSAPKAASASASTTPKKSEPMPTSLPEKFETVKFVDIPDSKY